MFSGIRFRNFSSRKSGGAQEVGSSTSDAERLKKLSESIRPKHEEDIEEESSESEEDELKDVFTNVENRFEKLFEETKEKIDELVAVKENPELQAEYDLKHAAKTAVTGRIQFEGVLIEEEKLPLLLCDNCETRYSVIRCDACEEVMCLRCCELCHPIPRLMLRHPHEEETINYPPRIRAITMEDKSSVVIEPEFPVPPYYIEEGDLAIAKNVDLSKPNTLATNLTGDPAAWPQKLIEPYKAAPRYNVDDKLLFMDPVSGEQAYGRVLCEWDPRHGEVAPPILRGDGSMYLYVVEKIDLVKNVGTLADLLKIVLAKPPDPEYPKFQNVDDVPYRWEFEAAREVNRMLREMHEVQTKGPRRHFKAPIVFKDPNEEAKGGDGPGDSSSSVAMSPGRTDKKKGDKKKKGKGRVSIAPGSSLDSPGASLSSPLGAGSFGYDDDDMSIDTTLTPLTKKAQEHIAAEARKKQVADAHLGRSTKKKADEGEGEKKEEAQMNGYTTELTKEEMLDELRSHMPDNEANANPTSPRDASKRSFYHAVMKDNPLALASEEEQRRNAKEARKKKAGGMFMGTSKIKAKTDEPAKVIDLERALNVVVLPESALTLPAEVYDLSQANEQAQKLGRKEAYLSKILRGLVRRMTGLAFRLWWSRMHDLMVRKQNVCAQRIQAYVRRWLNRNTLARLFEEYLEDENQKWHRLHARFEYVTRDTPYSVTMDHRNYFRTKLGANRFSLAMDKAINGMCKRLLTKKYMKVMRCYYLKWRANAGGLNESELKFGHFDMNTVDIDEGLEPGTGDLGEKGVHIYPGKHHRDDSTSVESVSLASPQQGFPQGLEGGDSIISEGDALGLVPRSETNRPKTWLSHPNPNPAAAVSTHTTQQAKELYKEFRKRGTRAVPGDDNVYVNVSTLQVGMVRTPAVRPPTPDQDDEEVKKAQISKSLRGYYDDKDEDEEYDFDGELPPYMPSLDVHLPAAIPVWMPNNAEERLHVKTNRRLTYCSYKAHMQGPADDCCWVIPGRIAMGPIPWGRANKRTQTSTITALLLGRCDTFVSLMEDQEEKECEERLGIKPIAQTLKTSAAKARYAVDEVVQNSRRVVEEMRVKLAMIPTLDKKNDRYAENQKELTRCKARTKLANEAAVRAQKEFDLLPTSFEYIRVPLETAKVPTIHDILPVLWQLERKLSEGHNLYLYSREGHGRVGMLAGCLLGRLYGFTPEETLIRIQNCHDCAKREEGKTVPVSCPQMPQQRQLIKEVLAHSARPMKGVVWRSHKDPETQVAELYVPKKGTGSGLSYTEMTREVVHPLSISHSIVTKEDKDGDAMVREKVSVRHEFVAERDIKSSYKTEHGRGDDAVASEDMYGLDEDNVKQMKDVFRELKMQRQPQQGAGNDKNEINQPILRKRTAL